MIKIRSKSQSSTQIPSWISNWTEIDDRIWISNLIQQRRQFDFEPQITLAYFEDLETTRENFHYRKFFIFQLIPLTSLIMRLF